MTWRRIAQSLFITVVGSLVAIAAEPDQGVTPTTPATVEPLAPPVPFLFRHNGGHLEWMEGVPNALTGGVELMYEAIALKGERLEFAFGGHPASKQLVIDAAALAPGPNGPSPDRVLFDSRASQLPLVGFRGLFTPTAIVITRITAIDPAAPNRLSWRAVLKQPGHFAGELKSRAGWEPFAAWADEIEIVLRADLVGDGLANLRFAEVHFFGREKRDGQPRQLVRLDRVLKPLAKPEDLDGLEMDGAQYGLQTMKLTIEFAEDGSFGAYKPGVATTTYGTWPEDLRKRPRSLLAPAK
ncbi:MAG: hypothetical protein H0W72_10315 [Planctomycetes bacterium]|nr:hypothetical protein [Planctomycetota bacterium]